MPRKPAPKTASPAARGRPSSREAMLDAAIAVVMEQGASKLSLDAVARRAGASKGGVMYNFPTKDALLEALLDRLTSRNLEGFMAAKSALPEQPGRDLTAYVMNSVNEPDVDDHVSGALIAVVHGSPRLLRRVAGYFAARFEAISRDVAFERAALVHLATEGLWLMELLQLSPFSVAQRASVVGLLTGMASGQADVVFKAAPAKSSKKRLADVAR